MSVNETIPLCFCGTILGTEGILLWDIPVFIERFPLGGSLSYLLDVSSYDSRSLSDNKKWGLCFVGDISLSDSDWSEWNSRNLGLFCFFPTIN